MMKKLLYSLILFSLVSCKKENVETTSTNEEFCEMISLDHSHIKHFGFTLIDTYWDDPNDAEVKTVYNDEVHEFSNIADILVVTPTDNIIQRANDMVNFEMKAYLHLNEIFFEQTGTVGPSGASYDLRSDYQTRWDIFLATNDLVNNDHLFQALYIGEEPTWNDISYNELEAACNYVKNTITTIPIMIVEAYPAIDNLQIPTSVDWIGFDHYFVKNPLNDTDYQNELSLLKSKFSSPEQKLVIVMDTHYIPWAHGDFGGINQDEMKTVASNYFDLAIVEEKTIAIIGYTWPGGFDSSDMLGARQLNQETRDEYERIGKLITGK